MHVWWISGLPDAMSMKRPASFLRDGDSDSDASEYDDRGDAVAALQRQLDGEDSSKTDSGSEDGGVAACG